MGAKQGASFTKQLLAFARRQPFDPEVIEIDSAIDDVIALARHVMPPRIELSPEIEGGIWPSYADRANLQSTLLNLMINARDAMPDGGRITIYAGNTTFEAGNPDLVRGDYVGLSVQDTGCGMTPQVIARAFEPFFTTKGPGMGTGLVYRWSMVLLNNAVAPRASRVSKDEAQRFTCICLAPVWLEVWRNRRALARDSWPRSSPCNRQGL